MDLHTACLLQLMMDFQTAMRAKQPVSRPKRQRVREVSPQPRPVMEKRRSGRLQNQPAPNYNDSVLDKTDAVGGHRQDGKVSDTSLPRNLKPFVIAPANN